MFIKIKEIKKRGRTLHPYNLTITKVLKIKLSEAKISFSYCPPVD
jgi:hypothetical protein